MYIITEKTLVSTGFIRQCSRSWWRMVREKHRHKRGPYQRIIMENTLDIIKRLNKAIFSFTKYWYSVSFFIVFSLITRHPFSGAFVIMYT